MIDATGAVKPKVGDTVVFGFRPQVFVTRAFVVGVSGIASDRATAEAIHDVQGRPIEMAVINSPAASSADPASPVLSLRNIRKTFGGIVALKDFNLDLFSGEVVALVGDNGAGKSRHYVQDHQRGFTRRTRGKAWRGIGITITDPSQSQALGIQVVFQDLALADSQPSI